MTIVRRKHYKLAYIIFFLFFLNNCQLKEANEAHGINFLENREKTITIGKTNQNDVIKLIGHPHTKSIKAENTWIYFERTTSRGKLIKLGQKIWDSDHDGWAQSMYKRPESLEDTKSMLHDFDVFTEFKQDSQGIPPMSEKLPNKLVQSINTD